MPKIYRLIAEDGSVERAIIAEPEFVEAEYPGRYVLVGDAPPPIVISAVPATVSMRQAKRALLAAGLLDSADMAIAGIADDTARRAAQIDWTSATDVRRDWPLVASIAQALSLTDEQIDALFVAASQL